jgi:hypothetical protein
MSHAPSFLFHARLVVFLSPVDLPRGTAFFFHCVLLRRILSFCPFFYCSGVSPFLGFLEHVTISFWKEYFMSRFLAFAFGFLFFSFCE